MGFLNNTTVTVDAILTKKGRELLAKGTDEFNITKFALADDEVDYNLWDVTHPNGSDFYGNVIENMPLFEASPDETQVMKFKLLSLTKLATNSLPILVLSQEGSITFSNANHEPKLITANTENQPDSTYSATISDGTVATFSGGGTSTEGSITRTYALGENIQIVPLQQTVANTGATANLIVEGGDTGFKSIVAITNNYNSTSPNQ